MSNPPVADPSGSFNSPALGQRKDHPEAPALLAPRQLRWQLIKLPEFGPAKVLARVYAITTGAATVMAGHKLKIRLAKGAAWNLAER